MGTDILSITFFSFLFMLVHFKRDANLHFSVVFKGIIRALLDFTIK